MLVNGCISQFWIVTSPFCIAGMNHNRCYISYIKIVEEGCRMGQPNCCGNNISSTKLGPMDWTNLGILMILMKILDGILFLSLYPEFLDTSFLFFCFYYFLKNYFFSFWAKSNTLWYWHWCLLVSTTFSSLYFSFPSFKTLSSLLLLLLQHWNMQKFESHIFHVYCILNTSHKVFCILLDQIYF